MIRLTAFDKQSRNLIDLIEYSDEEFSQLPPYHLQELILSFIEQGSFVQITAHKKKTHKGQL